VEKLVNLFRADLVAVRGGGTRLFCPPTVPVEDYADVSGKLVVSQAARKTTFIKRIDNVRNPQCSQR
jgi:hypothetical protein